MNSDVMTIDRIEVTNCRNGYARAIVNPPPDHPLAGEGATVLLKKTGDGWQMIANGTAITCSSTDEEPAEIVEACRALGIYH